MGKHTYNTINIVSFNVRGLRNCNKRKALWTALKENNVHICMLQETYLTKDIENEVNFELGDDFICKHSYGTNHSCGVSLLIRQNAGIEILNTHGDNNGRIVLANLKIKNNIYPIVNIYSLNKENERKCFFNKIENWIHQYGEANTRYIVAGDFNYAVDPAIDRNPKCITKQERDVSKQGFVKLCCSCHLQDIWRLRNPSVKQFTCKSQNRIDLFLCTDEIINYVTQIEIRNGYVYSDHQLVKLQLHLSCQRRGPGYWKLNCSLLTKADYIEGIKSIIGEMKEKEKTSNQNNYCGSFVKENLKNSQCNMVRLRI